MNRAVTSAAASTQAIAWRSSSTTVGTRGVRKDESIPSQRMCAGSKRRLLDKLSTMSGHRRPTVNAEQISITEYVDQTCELLLVMNMFSVTFDSFV